MTVELKTRCVNAHDRCAGSYPCPYCEPEIPLRDSNTGKFVSENQLLEQEEYSDACQF